LGERKVRRKKEGGRKEAEGVKEKFKNPDLSDFTTEARRHGGNP
jgi:hypothetical protein